MPFCRKKSVFATKTMISLLFFLTPKINKTLLVPNPLIWKIHHHIISTCCWSVHSCAFTRFHWDCSGVFCHHIFLTSSNYHLQHAGNSTVEPVQKGNRHCKDDTRLETCITSIPLDYFSLHLKASSGFVVLKGSVQKIIAYFFLCTEVDIRYIFLIVLIFSWNFYDDTLWKDFIWTTKSCLCKCFTSWAIWYLSVKAAKN